MSLNFYKNKYLGIPMLVVLAFLAQAGVASAQIFGSAPTSSEPVRAACELNKAMDNLLAIKDSNLTGAARDRAEFKARKEVLGQTINCSLLEIDSAKSKLDELNSASENDEALTAQFLKELNLSLSSYELYAVRVATTTGLLEVKDLAGEILEWRNEYYLPLLQKISNFTLLTTSERAVEIATSRFEKISGSLSILRLSQVPGIKASLESAAKLTKGAAQLNKEARSIVDSYLVATSTATSTVEALKVEDLKGASTTTEEVASSTAKAVVSEAAQKPEVVDLVKASLNSLKLAYGDYLKISGLVKEILGL